MRKILSLLIFTILILGCQRAEKSEQFHPSHSDIKKPMGEIYKLKIEKNCDVIVQRIKPYSKEIRPIVAIIANKGQTLSFENGKKEVEFKVPPWEGSVPIIQFPIFSNNGDSIKLFGLFNVYASPKPKYQFIDYAYLTNPSKIYDLKKVAKEESTHSHDWVSAWDSCKGYIALKKDGSLWQFGKIGGCDWGQIYMTKFDYIDREIYTYYLDSKKIADGFKDAKIANGGYRLYAIKKDGSLWGWGEGTKAKPTKIGKSNDWLDVNVNITIHEGLDYDLGLKKDGSLWKIYSYDNKYKVELLTKKHSWDKVLIDCCAIFGQKKDSSLWGRYNDESNFKKITPKDKNFGYSIDNYSKLLMKMKSLSSNSVKNYNVYTTKVQVRKDGRLWLLPKVKIESVEKRAVFKKSRQNKEKL